uniref:Uncharacterized protein n=1 Tax=Tricholoma terreum TaxID=76328 RepID=A0A6C0W3P9_9AGAR|nr:hypothetical protein [Tricholoma terreum]QIC20225.1 hypothetical protein [Tricholoma terreum]
MKLIKGVLYSLDSLVTKLMFKLDRLEHNHNYLKLKSYYHAIINIFRDTYLFHKYLFSNIGYYISFMFKIFKFSLILTIIYRLALILNIFLGFDIILAYHKIDNDMLMDIIYNFYSNMIIIKNQCLQWLIDNWNSLITIDHIISEPIIESTVSPIEVETESSSNIKSLRADYKDTVISIEKESSFYQSPYFYIPVSLIAITIIGLGCVGYYYSSDISSFWDTYLNAYMFDIYPQAQENSTSIQSSPSQNSDYFQSPEIPVIEITSPEGSTVALPETSPSSTPRALQLELTEYYYHQYIDPFDHN